MDATTPYPEAVTARILDLITQLGTSINAVAPAAGMTPNVFKRRAAGHSFRIAEVAQIARALGVEVEELVAPRRAA